MSLAVEGYAAEEQAILAHLDEHYSSLPVAWPNQPFKRPDASGWVEVRVTDQEAFRVTLGASHRVRHPGMLMATVHWPAGEASQPALGEADTIASLFRDTTITPGLTFRSPTVRKLGPDDGWYRVQVTAPFYRDSDFGG